MPQKIRARTIITAHNNADFDCLSSMVAAQMLYPEAAVIFPGSQEQSLRDFFLQSATYLFNFYAFKDIDPACVETLVLCDTRQRSRLSHIGPLLKRTDLTVHAFDHHPDSEDDIPADYQIVRPWGSTVAVMVSILRQKDLSPGPDQATFMGLGLYEDTGCFTFSSTTEHDLEAAYWLKTKGMDIGFISDFLNREMSAEQVALLNTLLENASNHSVNGVDICLTQISTEHYVRDFALLVHKMMEIESLKVLFALARMQDRVHLVARSRVPAVDAGTICASFGGAGHAYAASATIKDKTLAQVQDELFGLLYSHVNPQITVQSLMSSPPVTIKNSSTIAEASTTMTRYGLKAVPVVQEGTEQCVGILEHQLADRAQSHGLGEFQVREYMLRSFSQVTPRDSLYAVMEIIIEHGQRLVPVEMNGDIVGVITRTDLINSIVEEPARIPESLLPEKKREKNIKSLVRNRLPAAIFNLLDQAGNMAESLGYRVYAVGGFVRDILLHRPNLDIDLVVEGDGIAFASKLAESLNGRIRSHRKFKTAVIILPDGQRIDVATARLEYYEHPAALPTVELSSIKMDLFRRDFSINALAIELNPGRFGRLVDFFDGQNDIKEKIIRVLHSLSFIEDPTRILRAIRFEQRFNFRIGAQTERLIKNALQLNMFHKLTGSRIFQELKLILQEKRPLTCLKRMQSFGLLEAIHPLLSLDQSRETVLEKTEKIMDWYELLYTDPTPEVWRVYFLGLTTGMNDDHMRILSKRLNFPEKLAQSFLQLRRDVQAAKEELIHWQRQGKRLSRLYFILHPLPIEGILYLMAFSKRETVRKHISLYLSQLKDEDIDISGQDLKDLGLPPGPAYNRILKTVLTAKLDGRARDRHSQLDLSKRLVQGELAGQERA